MYLISDAKNVLATELANGYATLEDLEDRLGEYVDSALPIYYSDIIDEWRAMPSNYDGAGVDELGVPEKPTVYSLMTGDLYLYYSDLYRDALAELIEESETN